MKAKMNALTFFSANLSKLLPTVPLGNHQRHFAETAGFQRLVMDDTLNERWLRTLQHDECLRAIRQKPGVIASFHIGAYRLLPMWLIGQGIPLTLLVTADVAESQAERYRTIIGRLPGDGAPLEICRAEDSQVLRKLAGAMARGHCIMAFLDGNAGAAARTKHARNRDLAIDFLAHRLRVKTGIAELAYLTGRPIYPMTMMLDDRGVPLPDVLPPITRGDTDKRELFVQTAMARLYRMLAEAVERSPAQWEGWFNVHHDLLLGKPAPEDAFVGQYLPFAIGSRYFLLHRHSYGVYPLPHALFDKLCAFHLNKTAK